MSALLVGYARCSTDQQDLTAQRGALYCLGVGVDRIYVDDGLTGTNGELGNHGEDWNSGRPTFRAVMQR